MARIRTDFVAGALDATLSAGATSMSSPGLADLAAVTAPDIAAISLYTANSDGRITKKEIVYVTAHTASATTATIERGKEGTSDQAWSSGDKWEHGATKADFPARLHVRDEKASGTDGGSFTSGSWQTRVLNTVMANEIAGASLASNQITLPAGNYEVDADAPGFIVNNHQTRLRNITAGTTLVVGTTEFTLTTANVSNRSRCRGGFTLTVSSVIELQHQCQTTKTTDGLGNAGGFGEVEVYADVIIRKVA